MKGLPTLFLPIQDIKTLSQDTFIIQEKDD